MRSKVMAWMILMLFILLGAQAVLGGPDKRPLFLEVYGGFDESWNYWALTDENLVPLEDGDVVMALWTGTDEIIDPPVRAVGSPLNGQPTADDLELEISGGGVIEYSTFHFTITIWNTGETDSLGRQRHPIEGEKIYVRVFNDGNLTDASAYGDSEVYEVLDQFGEIWFAQMPNDPTGPTTDQIIYGRYFKVIGGIDPNTGETYPLRDPHGILEDGDVVQLIWVGSDGEVDRPDQIDNMPGDDDELIEVWGINEGMYPSNNTGVFRRSTASFDDPAHGLPAEGQDVYVRVFNANNILAADCYGDSPIYTVSYDIGESLSVFYDDSVDCDTNLLDPPGWLFIHGGLNPGDLSIWPLIDDDGLRLRDGDLVQFIWAGPDTLIDEMDASTGLPAGDDSLLATCEIGEGMSSPETGRFEHVILTWRAHDKGGYPAEGDVIYLRVFNDSICTDATHYGESQTHMVAYELMEYFYTFPDSAGDAIIPNPSCTTSVEEWAAPEAALPSEYALYQNCPNPFNAVTEIRYALPRRDHVSLEVYNVLGVKVATLVDAPRRAGTYTVRWDARDLASGVYFCRMQAGGVGKTVKMVLLR